MNRFSILRPRIVRCTVATLLPKFRDFDFFLCLILSFSILIGNLARFIRLKKQNLTKPSLAKTADRNRRGIRNGDRDESFPLRLKRRDIHQNPGRARKWICRRKVSRHRGGCGGTRASCLRHSPFGGISQNEPR